MAELISEDFGPEGTWVVRGAVHLAVGVFVDIQHHHMADGGWAPHAEFAAPGDAAVMAVEARKLLDRMDAAVKAAKSELASVERVARLRAARRTKASEA